jgi:hypothetical protein
MKSRRKYCIDKKVPLLERESREYYRLFCIYKIMHKSFQKVIQRRVVEKITINTKVFPVGETAPGRF